MDNLSIVAALAVAVLILRLLRWGRRDAHLPPGPATTPFLGNALQFPKSFLQLQYARACCLYS